MGRGPAITDVERGQIKAYLHEGKSEHEIARLLGRSQKLVFSAIKRGLDNSPGISSGRKRKLDDRWEHQINRAASNKKVSSTSIKAEFGLNVHRSTVWRVLHRSPHLQYKKMAKRPKISAKNVEERKKFARTYMTWENEWQSVLFSDEKPFDLDGPSGWNHWHDICKDEVQFSNRKLGGGTVKVWFAMSYNHKSELAFIEGPFNSNAYMGILASHLLPLREAVDEESDSRAVFQQDNAPQHTSDATQHWLEERGIPLLLWPSNSPDLNPMENIFGVLARSVYEAGRQFSSKEQLKEAIVDSWAKLSQDTIRHVIDSMPNRIYKLIEAKGHNTEY